MNTNPLADLHEFLKALEQEQGKPFSPEVWAEVAKTNPFTLFGMNELQFKSHDAKALLFWTVNGGSREAFMLYVGPVRYEQARREVIEVLSE